MKKIIITIIAVSSFICASCGTSSYNTDEAYQHFSISLACVADIHNNKEILYYTERSIVTQKIGEFDNYSSYFDNSKSFLKCRCLLDDKNVPYGEMDFKITMKDGTILAEEYNVKYKSYGSYYIYNIYSDVDSKYNCHFDVVNPYWVRMQMPVVLPEVSPDPIILTFEYNKPLRGDENIPDIFLSSSNE